MELVDLGEAGLGPHTQVAVEPHRLVVLGRFKELGTLLQQKK